MTVQGFLRGCVTALGLTLSAWCTGAIAQGQPMMPMGQPMMPMMPMAPGAQPMMPMMPMAPGAQPMMPMMPMAPGAHPMMPMMPMAPGAQPMMPMMPMTPGAQPMMPMMPMTPGAQPMMPMAPGGAQARPMQPSDMLDLSDEQRAQMAAIAQETQVAIMAIMKDMYTQSGTLRGLFQTMPPDPQQIGSAYAKMFDLQRQVIETNITAFNRYMGVLSDEQRATWESMRNSMMRGYGMMPH